MESEPAVYGCLSVKELPRPHVTSVKQPCKRCSGKVWVDPIGYQRALADGPLEIMCMECVRELVGVDG